MKKIMLTAVIIITGKISADSNVNMIPFKWELDQIEQSYVYGLQDNNLGVVESAIYCAIKIQLTHPDKTFSRLVKILTDLSRQGSTPQIRYKANVACLYLKNPELINRIILRDYQDGSEFWSMLVQNIDPVTIVINN